MVVPVVVVVVVSVLLEAHDAKMRELIATARKRVRFFIIMPLDVGGGCESNSEFNAQGLSLISASRPKQPVPDVAQCRATAKQHRFIQLAPQDLEDLQRALFAGHT